MTTTEPTTCLTVGVVIARERVDHPWQEFRWVPVEVLIGIPDITPGTIVTEDSKQTAFYAGEFQIELHRKETPSYVVNLENEVPVVYIVLSETDDDDQEVITTSDGGELPCSVANVTVSPFEAQDYLDSGEDIVEPVPMSEPLIAWLEHFVAEHHEEEAFIKRKRDRVDIKNEKFGQEPLEVIRRRQRQH